MLDEENTKLIHGLIADPLWFISLSSKLPLRKYQVEVAKAAA